MKVVVVYILLDVAVDLVSRIRVVSIVARDRRFHHHLASGCRPTTPDVESAVRG